MSDVITTTLEIYKNYSGSSMINLFLAAAVLYLWVVEERKEIRYLFVYLSMVIGFLFFFPLFSYVAIHYFLDKEVYYRLLWLIPMGTVVSYAAVRALAGIPEKRKRFVVGCVFMLLIVQGGNLVYHNKMVTRAENLYHLPESVIEVADILHVDGANVKAVVPSEMLQFIRQYDTTIELAYGREALVDGWSSNPLYEAMEEIPMHSFAVTDYSKQQRVQYLVIRTGTPIVGDKPIDKYQFTLLTTVGHYDIYIYDKAPFFDEKMQKYGILSAGTADSQ